MPDTYEFLKAQKDRIMKENTFERWVYWDENNNQPHSTPSGRTFMTGAEPKDTDCYAQSANWKRPIGKRKVRIEVIASGG